jgi:uncharacterized protein YacL
MHDQILKAYRIYCWINVVWYCGIVFLGSFSLALYQMVDLDLPRESIIQLNISSILTIALGFVFGIVTIRMMRQPITYKNWVWHYVNICLGITTCCLAPYCLWLAMRWNDKEFRNSLGTEGFQL